MLSRIFLVHLATTNDPGLWTLRNKGDLRD